MSSLSDRVVDADFPIVDGGSIGGVPGVLCVIGMSKSDESKAATLSRSLVLDDEAFIDSAVLHEDGFKLVLVRIQRHTKNPQHVASCRLVP